jgi:hypothetical protein
MTFGARVHAAIRERGPFCAGIDPHGSLLTAWGLDDDVAGWSGSRSPRPRRWRRTSPS